jgi:RNA ligase (TIGR02306 family)
MNAQYSVVVFGEIFGAGVQDMQYGQSGLGYRVFDIAVDGQYINANEMLKILRDYHDQGILSVPYLHVGPFSMAKMEELVSGPTTMATAEQIKEPFKGREGIVIRPVKERLTDMGHRAILKYVSVDYHERRNKDKSEDH